MLKKECHEANFRRQYSVNRRELIPISRLPQSAIPRIWITRTLLKAAAWVPPPIKALTPPQSSYVANVSGTDRSGKSKGEDGQHGDNGNHFGQVKK